MTEKLVKGDKKAQSGVQEMLELEVIHSHNVHNVILKVEFSTERLNLKIAKFLGNDTNRSSNLLNHLCRWH